MKILYEFDWDYGRMGRVRGLFIATKQEVNDAIGKELYFGEILGKHSEVYGPLESEDVIIKSEDQDFISKLEEVIGSRNISGYNPLDCIQESEDENE